MTNINISSPDIPVEQALFNIEVALRNGQIAQGPQVKKAEEMMRDIFDSGYASAISSGTASLKSSLVGAVAYKFGVDRKYIDRFLPGKEIIVPAYSFNASLNTIMQLGATARIIDIDPEDFCIDKEAAEESINTKTVGVMPVDLYGQAADLSNQDRVFEAVAVVRDAAQAHGAKLQGQSIVKHGDATSLSFYPTKNILTAEGGAVLTDEEEIDKTVKIYRNQGMSERYVYEMAGDNLRMSDLHAAILRATLGNLALVTKRRQQNAELLSNILSGVDGLILPRQMPGREHVWHQYTVRVTKDFGKTRNELADQLKKQGIGTGVYYPKIMTDHDTFTSHPRIIKDPTPNADTIATQALSLPIHPKVTDTDIERIGQTIIDIRGDQ